jgi:hypothetical protein
MPHDEIKLDLQTLALSQDTREMLLQLYKYSVLVVEYAQEHGDCTATDFA